MSNIAIAVTCFTVLFIIGAILPYVQADFIDESADYNIEDMTENTVSVNASQIGQDVTAQGTNLFDIIKSIFGVFTWSFNVGYGLNIIFWLIKIIMILALGDMIWVG